MSLFVALLAALPGCDRGSATAGPESTLSTEEFIAVVVELREAEREVALSDSAGAEFEARKVAILERHGTSEDDLRSFLVQRREDVDFLRELWDTLNERLRHVPPRHEGGMEGATPLIED